MDLDILVRKKPFREEDQGGVINDVDSEGEDTKDSKSIRSEFLGGGGEDDCEEQEDIEGDPTVRRQALFKMTLDECRAVLRRDRELERARAPGRHKQADMQMKKIHGNLRTRIDDASGADSNAATIASFCFDASARGSRRPARRGQGHATAAAATPQQRSRRRRGAKHRKHFGFTSSQMCQRGRGLHDGFT